MITGSCLAMPASQPSLRTPPRAPPCTGPLDIGGVGGRKVLVRWVGLSAPVGLKTMVAAHFGTIDRFFKARRAAPPLLYARTGLGCPGRRWQGTSATLTARHADDVTEHEIASKLWG